MKAILAAAAFAVMGAQADAATLTFDNLLAAWIDSETPWESSATTKEAGYTIRGTADTGCNLDGTYGAGKLGLQDSQGCMSWFGAASISASGREFSIFSFDLAGAFPNAIRYHFIDPVTEDFVENKEFGGDGDDIHLGAKVVSYRTTKLDGSMQFGSIVAPYGSGTHKILAPEDFTDIVSVDLFYRRTFDQVEVLCEETNINSGIYSNLLVSVLPEICNGNNLVDGYITKDGYYFDLTLSALRTGSVSLDNFEVSPVPIPASGLALLAGLGILTAAQRSRTARQQRQPSSSSDT